MKSNSVENQKGIIALMTILIILGIALAVGIGLGLSSINETEMSLQKSQSSGAYYLTNLCVEQALMKLKENSGYGGNETINTADGQCTILPIEGRWIIKVSASSSGQVKKIKIVVNKINPKMTFDSWEETSDF